MEYADRGSLADVLKSKHGSTTLFDEDAILDWFVQIVSALRAMHARSILHRDLKAANVFLTSRNLIKVGDFGISKMLEKNDGLASTTIGTPYYLAPEVRPPHPHGLFALEVPHAAHLVTLNPPRCPSIHHLGHGMLWPLHPGRPDHQAPAVRPVLPYVLPLAVRQTEGHRSGCLHVPTAASGAAGGSAAIAACRPATAPSAPVPLQVAHRPPPPPPVLPHFPPPPPPP
eukprot:scaffold11638_cov118-Isochrysis_galbana.AAC.1